MIQELVFYEELEQGF